MKDPILDAISMMRYGHSFAKGADWGISRNPQERALYTMYVNGMRNDEPWAQDIQSYIFRTHGGVWPSEGTPGYDELCKKLNEVYDQKTNDAWASGVRPAADVHPDSGYDDWHAWKPEDKSSSDDYDGFFHYDAYDGWYPSKDWSTSADPEEAALFQVFARGLEDNQPWAHEIQSDIDSKYNGVWPGTGEPGYEELREKLNGAFDRQLAADPSYYSQTHDTVVKRRGTMEDDGAQEKTTSKKASVSDPVLDAISMMRYGHSFKKSIANTPTKTWLQFLKALYDEGNPDHESALELLKNHKNVVIRMHDAAVDSQNVESAKRLIGGNEDFATEWAKGYAGTMSDEEQARFSRQYDQVDREVNDKLISQNKADDKDKGLNDLGKLSQDVYNFATGRYRDPEDTLTYNQGGALKMPRRRKGAWDDVVYPARRNIRFDLAGQSRDASLSMASRNYGMTDRREGTNIFNDGAFSGRMYTAAVARDNERREQKDRAMDSKEETVPGEDGTTYRIKRSISDPTLDAISMMRYGHPFMKSDDDYKIEGEYPLVNLDDFDWDRDYSQFTDKENEDYLAPYLAAEYRRSSILRNRYPTVEDYIKNPSGSDINSGYRWYKEHRKLNPEVLPDGTTIQPDQKDIDAAKMNEAYSEYQSDMLWGQMANMIADYLKDPKNLMTFDDDDEDDDGPKDDREVATGADGTTYKIERSVHEPALDAISMMRYGRPFKKSP